MKVTELNLCVITSSILSVMELNCLADKPLPPQGPLDVSDITPETCSLSWKPPLDDGGSPITNYVVEKLDPFTGVSNIMSFSYFFTMKSP
jgi:hypothetical protein